MVKTLPASARPLQTAAEAALVGLTAGRGCSCLHTLAAEGPAAAECGNGEGQ